MAMKKKLGKFLVLALALVLGGCGVNNTTSVSDYNTEIRTFPGRLWHSFLYSDMPIRETYQATKENPEEAPQVQF